MQKLICKLKNEISDLDSDTNVHSFYKYTLHPKYLNHNDNFISKYDDVPAFYPHSDYNDNGNKYNLIREFNKPVIHYEADNFIPDSYYEYNLKNTDHKKMMLNNIETENEISNDFNRRIRQSESGQPIQEIKQEDDERAVSLKKLLDTFNSDIDKTNDTMFMYDDRKDIIDETDEKIINLNKEYNRPKINKAIEDINYNKKINKFKKLNKEFTNDEAIDTKKYYYRQDEHNKKIMSKEIKDQIKQAKKNNKDKENEFNNIKLMNIEDLNTKKEIQLELKRKNEIQLELKREKEYENKIRRKIILKKEIKNELDTELDNDFFDSVEVSEGIKIFNQEDYNSYLNELSKSNNEFRGNELMELNKSLSNSGIPQLGSNTKIINNALNKINEHYKNIIKTQNNTPIKSNK